MMNYEEIASAIEGYKEYLPEHFKDEKYKWEAVKHFQDNWDIDAEDFGAMFKKATQKAGNLLASVSSFPRGMILEFAKADKEATRQMFRNLYDESIDLAQRIDDFVKASEDMRARYNDGTWKNHYQNTNAISVYLWLRYPDKYYIYKYEIYSDVSKEFESDFRPKLRYSVNNIVGGYAMYDELCRYLQADKDIRKMLDSLLTASCYPDTGLKTTTIDFGFYVSRFYLDEKEIAQQSLESKPEQSTNNDEESDVINTWLLVWNPKSWDWESVEETFGYKASLSTIRIQGANLCAWKCMSKQVKEGDRIFIIRLGQNPKGIMATGYAISDSYVNEYKERAVDICITGFLDYHTEPLISQDLLKEKFPDQQWSPQGSGISIKPDAAKWLIEEWNRIQYGQSDHISNQAKESIDTDTQSIPPETYDTYSKENFLSDVFMSEKEYDKLTALIKRKKNIILQGAPGVGKTYCAKRLAWSLMGEKDNDRVCMVQFHQSYSYEDFILGYRPDDEGGFELQEGVFYRFCENAKNDPDNDYYFIIDEINRGNLSKIFGELLMLIESDKRGEEHQIELIYGNKPFYIPENLHIIGMMNTADRSLAMIDYALRRRFSFYTMHPAFEKADENGFADYTNEIDCPLYHSVIDRIKELNKAIKDDSALGSGFEIGHSYFTSKSTDMINDEWVKNVVEYEIIPLIEEYWFDNEAECSKWKEKLYHTIGEPYDE